MDFKEQQMYNIVSNLNYHKHQFGIVYRKDMLTTGDFFPLLPFKKHIVILTSSNEPIQANWVTHI